MNQEPKFNPGDNRFSRFLVTAGFYNPATGEFHNEDFGKFCQLVTGGDGNKLAAWLSRAWPIYNTAEALIGELGVYLSDDEMGHLIGVWPDEPPDELSPAPDVPVTPEFEDLWRRWQEMQQRQEGTGEPNEQM